MIIDELLREAHMSRYMLSKTSGVPQATISDICSGKAELEKCTAGTLYKIAKALNVTVDSIIEAHQNEAHAEYRASFETFKSNTCHHVKDMGDIDFIIDTLEHDTVGTLYRKKWYPEAFYTLAMLDYLSRLNDLPQCTNYNNIRGQKLEKVIYPSSVLINAAVKGDDSIKQEARQNAITEFLRFNIVESEVRDIA